MKVRSATLARNGRPFMVIIADDSVAPGAFQRVAGDGRGDLSKWFVHPDDWDHMWIMLVDTDVCEVMSVEPNPHPL